MNAKLTTCVVAVLILWSSAAFAQDDAMEKQIADLIESMAASDYAGKAAVEKLVEIGKPAVGPLVAALKDPRRRVRYWSAAAAGRIKDERAYDPLVDMARNDKDAFCRATALWYLQHFPRQAVWDLAVAALKDPDGTVRGYAILLLKERGRTEAVPKLIEAMKHPDYKTRYDAMVAVTTLSQTDVTEMLRGVLRSDENREVRVGAMKCLTIRKEKPPAILTVLIDGLEDRESEVRTAAAALLRRGTTQEFPFDPDGDPEDRAVAVRNWRRWYDAHKDRLYWDDAKRRFETR